MTALLQLIDPDLEKVPFIYLDHVRCEPKEPIFLHNNLNDAYQFFQEGKRQNLR